MSISIQNETPITLSHAAKLLPKFHGKHPHTSTLWRWATVGLDGHKLESTKVGKRICTSIEALDRFINRDNVKVAESRPPEPDTSQELADISTHLEEEGFRG